MHFSICDQEVFTKLRRQGQTPFSSFLACGREWITVYSTEYFLLEDSDAQTNPRILLSSLLEVTQK